MVDQTKTRAKLLVVDDESAIRRILETRLSMTGYDVITAVDGQDAIEKFDEESSAFDLVVLDVMMPRLDGYAVCRVLREKSDVPIIMLTALGDIADRITGLTMGADDYIPKPFSPKELEARIQAILRRISHDQGADSLSNLPNRGIVRAGALKIDLVRRQVWFNDRLIRLTGMEFDLLQLLVTRCGDSVSRTEALEEVWGYTPRQRADARVVDVHISRLRSKIEQDPRNPEFIHTNRGTGYFFRRITAPPHAMGA
ncbi:MAG: response regulator transcription factor RpaB [Elainellaceae cyanobacterium]